MDNKPKIWLILLSVIVALAESSNPYCQIQSCRNNSHTLCRFPIPVLGHRCGRLIRHGLNGYEMNRILELHNELRAKVYAGREHRGNPGPLPRAHYFTYLQWDSELSLVAQRWAEQCDLRLDLCRHVVLIPRKAVRSMDNKSQFLYTLLSGLAVLSESINPYCFLQTCRNGSHNLCRFPVYGTWTLPGFVCDIYIAMDVMCSTSSIFNLVAISVDRYFAVTRPIEYAKHKNNRRVWLTIVLLWVVSAAIGSPIVLGLNNTPERQPDLCLFYHTDFIIYSSLSSFYIPCLTMVCLYYRIFSALHYREKKKRANRKSNMGDIKSGIIIENIANTRRFAETALGAVALVAPGIEEPTNTASGSNEDEDETPLDPVVVISNDKSTEFFLATVVEEAACRFGAVTQSQLSTASNRKDSGYEPGASSMILTDATEVTIENSSPSPHPKGVSGPSSSTSSSPPRGASSLTLHPKRNGNGPGRHELKQIQNIGSLLPLQFGRSNISSGSVVDTSIGGESTNTSKKERKNESSSSGSRFILRKANKANKKKGEKISAKKERKATKTLAIVLGVFLICWVPFFTCNIMDALCSKMSMDCQPGVTAFIATSWLGYMNSFVNPVIYTLFNPEFRKAFRKLTSCGSQRH